MRRALTIGVLGVSLIAPALARAGTQTATNGAVSATLTWQGQGPQITGLRLSISQSGAQVFSQAISSKYCGTLCQPGYPSPSVHVVDLSGDGNLEVVADVYTGGAHCCTVEQVFSWSAALGTYVKVEKEFGDPLAVLKDLSHNGKLEFLSADDVFAYAFTDFADSGFPIQIWSFSGGAFHNVTRRYPTLIARDARTWWHAYRGDLRNGEGLIAAWAADEYLLHRGATVRTTLAQQQRQGHITASFIQQLNRFLHRYGYR